MLSPRLLILIHFVVMSVAQAETTAIVNVNVLPMTSDIVLAARTVIVSDGKVQLIGDVAKVPIPEGVAVVDGTDRFLMPGLAEMHAHIPAAATSSMDRVFHLYVANGITLARGMLGQASHIELRQQLLDGEVLGPRLYTSGPSFNGRSVSSPEQAVQMARDQHAAGYDFLKIHPGLTRDEFDAVAGTANELGIPFAGHVPGDVGVSHALEQGIATIDHLDGYMQTLMPANSDMSGGFEGFFGLLLAGQADESKIPGIVDETRKAGTWNVATETLFEHLTSAMTADELRNWSEMRYMPVATVKQWVQSKESLVAESGYSIDLANRAIAIRRQIIKALHDAGAGLLLGSDSPQIFNVPGFSIHRELQFLVDAGLTPYEALLTGTVNPAVFFGRENDGGTIEPGRDADLVLLDANPLEEISATRRVHGVMLRGRWVSRIEIMQLLEALEQ